MKADGSLLLRVSIQEWSFSPNRSGAAHMPSPVFTHSFKMGRAPELKSVFLRWARAVPRRMAALFPIMAISGNSDGM